MRAAAAAFAVGLALAVLAVLAATAAAEPRRYGGYVCTIDCTAHAAGFRWAKARGVLRAHECIAAGRSFNEGCLTYVRYRGRSPDFDDAGTPTVAGRN